MDAAKSASWDRKQRDVKLILSPRSKLVSLRSQSPWHFIQSAKQLVFPFHQPAKNLDKWTSQLKSSNISVIINFSTSPETTLSMLKPCIDADKQKDRNALMTFVKLLRTILFSAICLNPSKSLLATANVLVLASLAMDAFFVNRLVYSTASAPNQPTTGTIGTMQCQTVEQAKDFKCSFPLSICSCQYDYLSAHCNCGYENPNHFIDEKENKLPLQTGPVTIETDYSASVKQHAGLQLQVDFKNVSVAKVYCGGIVPTTTSMFESIRTLSSVWRAQNCHRAQFN